MDQTRTLKAAMLGSGQFMVKLALLVIAAVLSRVLTKTDYASYRQTILVFSVMAPLLLLGLPEALYYFLPRAEKNARGILTGNLLALLSAGAVFAVFLLAGGNSFLAERFANPALKRLLLIYSPYALLALPVRAVDPCMVCSNRIKELTLYNIISRLFVTVVVIIMVLYWRTPEAAVAGSVISAFLVFIAAFILMFCMMPPGSWQPSAGKMLEQIKYSVPLGIAAIIGTLHLSLDKIIVSSMCPTKDFAVYINGAVELPFVGIITGSIMSVLIPEFVVLYKKGELSRIMYLWRGALVKT
ncbi:MAG: oligosaccharide flippase family protein, partial [Candidatus Omnitrophota bacterium]